MQHCTRHCTLLLSQAQDVEACTGYIYRETAPRAPSCTVSNSLDSFSPSSRDFAILWPAKSYCASWLEKGTKPALRSLGVGYRPTEAFHSSNSLWLFPHFREAVINFTCVMWCASYDQFGIDQHPVRHSLNLLLPCLKGWVLVVKRGQCQETERG